MSEQEQVQQNARFESKFTPEPNSGCWLWYGSLRSDGYGQFRAGNKLRKAHRVAYEAYRGPIPDGLHVLHRCDVRACVSPFHLFLGTNADNMADRNAKGRQAKGDASGSRTHPESRPRGEKQRQAKLTDANVLAIRAAIGKTQRQIASAHGVSKTLIGQVRRREIWSHIQ